MSVNVFWNATTPILLTFDVAASPISSIDLYCCPFVYNFNLGIKNSLEETGLVITRIGWWQQTAFLLKVAAQACFRETMQETTIYTNLKIGLYMPHSFQKSIQNIFVEYPNDSGTAIAINMVFIFDSHA
ncbi:hypothetical protein CDAR_318221 [Caerostris darwini]|uniref:Uncharacterized protein n=1 Tax=Caerostris darwini TaxID=1538125 RepID=A0AAV4T6S8_9ARAC|nr:hypothetical protein CDAR_318221 [Caerostris darwini]